MDCDLHLRIFPHQGLGAVLDERCSERACYNIETVRQHKACVVIQLLHEGVMVEPPHADPVLQLGKFIVKFCRGDRALSGEIPLVTGIDDAAAVLGAAAGCEFFQNIERGGGAFLIIRGKLVQALSVIGHAGRHSGDAAHPRVQGQKILQGAAQFLTVIDAAAQHQLTVQLNAARRKFGKILQHLTAALVGQHPHPQLRVGGVD